MVIPELEQQLLQLSHNDKLHIIQILAQSLTTGNTHSEKPTKISEFFRQSPLAELSEELDLNRDRTSTLSITCYSQRKRFCWYWGSHC